MTKPFQDIIPSLARILSGPYDVSLSLVRDGGELAVHRNLDPLSRHQKIALIPAIADIEAAMNDLPVIRNVDGDWSFAVKYEKPVDRKTRQAVFRITVQGFNISRAGSPSAQISTELMTEIQARLAQVERDTAPDDRAIRRWLVACRTRETATLLARSARQAAWSYAALCNRSRKESRAWRETPAQIRQIHQVHPEDEWRAPTP